MEDGPLLSQVLPRRQPRGVVARVAHLLLRLRPEHASSLRAGTVAQPAAADALRAAPRVRAACKAPMRSTSSTGCCRTTSPTPARSTRCSSREGARDRTPARVAPRRTTTTAAHRAGARRSAARPTRAHALRREVRGRTGRARLDDRARRREGIPNRDYGIPAVEVLDSELDGDADQERLRIEAGTPLCGRELDDRVLPAEAGLDERAISFTKGCYPGQEPIARQHYRGKVNRRLRVLEVDGTPAPETPVVHGEKGGRPRHERGGTGSRSRTCASRCRTTPSSRLAAPAARLHWPPERP